MALKNPKDLINNPIIDSGCSRNELEPPINNVVKKLSVTEGKDLEIAARINNPAVVSAVMYTYTVGTLYNSDYVMGIKDQILRTTVSKGGEGRNDFKDALKYGNNIPDACNPNMSQQNKRRIWEEEE